MAPKTADGEWELILCDWGSANDVRLGFCKRELILSAKTPGLRTGTPWHDSPRP